MKAFIKRNIKKIFYSLFFGFLILLSLLWFPSLIAQNLSCKDFPGSVYIFPNFVYKIADYIKSIENILGNISLLIAIILIISGLLQKGIPRIIAIILIIIFILIVSFNFSLSGSRVARDVGRSTALREITTALEMYYYDNKKYPGLPGSNQWNILESALVGKYLSQLPNDYCNEVNPEWTYEYWVSADGQKYVLKANFQTHFSLLDSDLDGNILGASCGENGIWEREYCWSPYFE